MNTDAWITAVLALRRARRVVVFTGAGISAESGVPTFRDADGFWKRFPPESFASWTGLFKTAVTQPRLVAEFVLNVVDPIARAKFNAGHAAVAEMARHVETTVVTQNIDGLHQAAGTTQVLEIHGSLLEVVDVSTRKVVRRFEPDDLVRIAAALRHYVERASSLVGLGLALRRLYPIDWRGRNRPNLVLFGDSLAEPAWTEACRCVDACDLLIAVGTSGAVYPAALLPNQALDAGATVVTIDPQTSFGCWLEGRAGDVLPRLVHDAFQSPPPKAPPPKTSP